MLNIYRAEPIAEETEGLEGSGIELEQTSVKTKEYPQKQGAHELRFRVIPNSRSIVDGRAVPHRSNGFGARGHGR